MSNPVVLITGALTGIGRAAAVAFAKKGAKVDAVKGITKSAATRAPSSRPAVSTATAQWRSSTPAMQTS